MRALTYTENGGPEVLHVAAMPEPHAGPGQIRVKVAAASINPIDWKLIGGFMPGSEATTEAHRPRLRRRRRGRRGRGGRHRGGGG